MSAGWIWHPFDTVRVFDLELSSGGLLALKTRDGCCDRAAEVASATFNVCGQLVMTSAKGADDFYSKVELGERLSPGTIAVYDLDRRAVLSVASLQKEAGTIMPVGSRHVVGFYDHPKLIVVDTGQVVCEWPDVNSGQQLSSILWHKPLPPPIALDPKTGRFAVAGEEGITIITLSPNLLD